VGSIRRGVNRKYASAQANCRRFGQCEVIVPAELAQDYFQLTASMAEADLLQRDGGFLHEYLTLTNKRYAAGVAVGSGRSAGPSRTVFDAIGMIDLGQLAQLDRDRYSGAARPPGGS